MRAAEISARFRSIITFETIIFAILIISLFVRLLFLDLKLFHHDEAVHAWFSYRLLTEGAYVYDPSYHGPFLYYVTSAAFWLFGDSDLTGRLLPAIAGAMIVALLYPLYRMGYLEGRQAAIAALFIAVSPSMVYFSRFLRHDIFQLFFTLLLLVSLLAYHRTGKGSYALLAATAAAGGICCKEDMPLILLIFVAYGLYLLWRGRLRLPASWKRDAVRASLLFLGICLILYSSFGMHPEVILGRALDGAYVGEHGWIGAFSESGWYRAAEHWLSMHGICRICGPPYFYLLLFVLYELPIFALAIVGTGQFLHRELWESAARYCPSGGRLGNWKCRLSEMPGRGTHGGLTGTRAGTEEFFRFCLFWMLATLAIYAWIGEKVPWLLLHQLLPVIFVAVYAMTPRKTIVALLSVTFLIAVTWHVAFVPADVNEPIVQVQNSEDLREVMRLIDASDSIVVASKNYWPLPWYYRGNRSGKLLYYMKRLDEDTVLGMDPDLVIAYDVESYESLPGYEKRTFRNNYWFSYYDQQDRLLEYYFRRDGPVGSMNFDVFVKTGEP